MAQHGCLGGFGCYGRPRHFGVELVKLSPDSPKSLQGKKVNTQGFTTVTNSCNDCLNKTTYCKYLPMYHTIDIYGYWPVVTVCQNEINPTHSPVAGYNIPGPITLWESRDPMVTHLKSGIWNQLRLRRHGTARKTQTKTIPAGDAWRTPRPNKWCTHRWFWAQAGPTSAGWWRLGSRPNSSKHIYCCFNMKT